MRLGAPEPINQDLRNQILGEIKAGRDLKAKTDQRAASAPAGRANPFDADQAAYQAALTGYAQSNPTVTTLENRLSSTAGPYWMDLTDAEKNSLALWNESLKDLDEITRKHYPTSGEMDLKKAALFAIAIGAIFGPLLFTKQTGSGFPFSMIPTPPELPFGRIPQGLPAPVRVEAPGMPYRQVERVALPAAAERPVSTLPQVDTYRVPSVVSRPGYVPPPRFSRGFSDRGGAQAPAGTPDLQRITGNVMRRPEGGRSFIYPKGRS
jgi:hypothetical protein